jgi:hypothetical protein
MVYQEVAGAKLTSKQKLNLFVAAMEVYERVEDDLDVTQSLCGGYGGI